MKERLKVHQILNRITYADKEKRRSALTSILKENEIPFTVYCNKINENLIQNIVVSINSRFPKLVIGAHYDSVEGSTGANDNAAAVCILIEFIKRIMNTSHENSIDIVFFDCEEIADKGSEEYIKRFGANNIKAMINLDMCGVGDTIVLGPNININKGFFSFALTNSEIIAKHKVRVIDFMPQGDEASFEKHRIPNISLAMMPYGEVDLIEKIFKYIHARNYEELSKIKTLPSIMDTMHNGSKDNIEVVETSAMIKMLNFLIDLIYNLEKCYSVI